MKHLTLTVYDQNGMVSSVDSINPEDIIRTKFVISKRTLLIVVREPYEAEEFQTVPDIMKPGAKKPMTFSQKKVNKKGYFVQGVTDEEEIYNFYEALTDNNREKFQGFKLYNKYKLQAEEALKHAEESNKERQEELVETEDKPEYKPDLKVVEE